MAHPVPRVLIVDDNIPVCLAIAGILEQEGYEAEMVHDGAQALIAIAERRFRLAVIDAKLGRESGFDLAREILDRRPGFRMILMSGSLSIAEWLEEYPELKHVPVLRKPFGRTALLGCVRQALDQAA